MTPGNRKLRDRLQELAVCKYLSRLDYTAHFSMTTGCANAILRRSYDNGARGKGTDKKIRHICVDGFFFMVALDMMEYSLAIEILGC